MLRMRLSRSTEALQRLVSITSNPWVISGRNRMRNPWQSKDLWVFRSPLISFSPWCSMVISTMAPLCCQLHNSAFRFLWSNCAWHGVFNSASTCLLLLCTNVVDFCIGILADNAFWHKSFCKWLWVVLVDSVISCKWEQCFSSYGGVCAWRFLKVILWWWWCVHVCICRHVCHDACMEVRWQPWSHFSHTFLCVSENTLGSLGWSSKYLHLPGHLNIPSSLCCAVISFMEIF